jgi:uncharacterized protein (DUF983 family)
MEEVKKDYILGLASVVPGFVVGSYVALVCIVVLTAAVNSLTVQAPMWLMLPVWLVVQILCIVGASIGFARLYYSFGVPSKIGFG